MPQGANIVVKKNDGTTDVTYTFIQPASSNSPAVFRNASVGSAPVHQPELRVAASTEKNRARVRGTFVYPQIATNSTTGVTSVVEKAFGSYETVVPRTMSQVDINEFASQLANLIASTLMKQCVKDGTSAV